MWVTAAAPAKIVALTDLPSSAKSLILVAPQPSHLPSLRWVPQRLPPLRLAQRATTSAVRRNPASTRKRRNGLVAGVTRGSAIGTGPSGISPPLVSRSLAVTAGVGSVPLGPPVVATSNGSLARGKRSNVVSLPVTRTMPSKSNDPLSRWLHNIWLPFHLSMLVIDSQLADTSYPFVRFSGP